MTALTEYPPKRPPRPRQRYEPVAPPVPDHERVARRDEALVYMVELSFIPGRPEMVTVDEIAAAVPALKSRDAALFLLDELCKVGVDERGDPHRLLYRVEGTDPCCYALAPDGWRRGRDLTGWPT